MVLNCCDLVPVLLLQVGLQAFKGDHFRQLFFGRHLRAATLEVILDLSLGPLDCSDDRGLKLRNLFVLVGLGVGPFFKLGLKFGDSLVFVRDGLSQLGTSSLLHVGLQLFHLGHERLNFGILLLPHPLCANARRTVDVVLHTSLLCFELCHALPQTVHFLANGPSATSVHFDAAERHEVLGVLRSQVVDFFFELGYVLLKGARVDFHKSVVHRAEETQFLRARWKRLHDLPEPKRLFEPGTVRLVRFLS
mmetsp:Transcript_20512/g.65463  ORF Transcript_20512/g.65463 Transcript_20512/m.65463 type:complete len:249 (-) Transcript_20512:632-1378(-)